MMTRPNLLPSIIPTELLLIAAALFCFCCAGCQTRPQQSDPTAALQFWSAAEQHYEAKDLPAAVAAMEQAAGADPGNLPLAQRRGEFLEMNADPASAARVYTTALAQAAATDPIRLDLSYQLALLFALKLQQPNKAADLLTQYPAADPRRKVMAAAYAVATNDPRAALEHLNDLHNQPVAQLVASRAAYVAALAYLKLDQREQATGALYRAINLAGKTLVAYDIEQLWQQMRATGIH